MNEVQSVVARPRSIMLTIASSLVLLTCFVLPLSSSAKSIGLTASLIAILGVGSYRLEIVKLLTTSWARASLILFGFVVMACLWSTASLSQTGFMVEKYTKILYLPVLVVVFKDSAMRWAGLRACLFGMALVSGLALLSYLQWVPMDSDYVFRNHIAMGLMGACSAFVSAHLAVQTQGKTRFMYVLLTGLFSVHVLAVNGGRTGYVLYAGLGVVWLWQNCTWRQSIYGLMVLMSLLFSSYEFSPVMHVRIGEGISDWRAYHHDTKETPVGYRFLFHAFAKKQFLQHPLIGNGTGSFRHAVQVHHPFPTWEGHLVEPHSQYWLMLAEGGLIGWMIMLYFYGCLLFTVKKLKQTGCIAVGLIGAFLLSQCSDSMLFYSGSGFFFMIYMAICLGEAHENII